MAARLVDVCSKKELRQFLDGDLSVVRKVITEELLLNDYQGVFLDIILGDLFTQKKKPILVNEFEGFAEFLMSDISLYLLKYNLSKIIKR